MNSTELQYPATYNIAENASQDYQKKHILSKKWEYGSIILAAFIGIFPIDSVQQFYWPAFFTGLSLLVALFVLVLEKSLKFQKGWYRTRVLAESVKAESWKFRCCCKPYSQPLALNDAIKQFLDILSKIKETSYATKFLSGYLSSGDEVTEDMISTRQKSLKERVSYYRKFRIEEQLNWYSTKANNAKTYYDRFYIAAIICLLIGIILSIFKFFGKTGQYAFVGFFSSAVIALFGWMQVRRYETLSITYAKVVEELQAISQILSLDSTTEEDFEEMVNATEMIISKEHTTWVTKSGVV